MEAPSAADQAQARRLVQAVKQRGVTVADHLAYLAHLRHHRPLLFDHLVRELQRQDPPAWLRLQKYPQFRPMSQTLTGHNAADKRQTAGTGWVAGSLGGSVEQWLAHQVQGAMQRDRFGPYARPLGNGRSAHTGMASVAVTPRGANQQHDAARAGLRASKATASARALSPGLDLGLTALHPDTHRAAAPAAIELQLQRALAAGILDEGQHKQARKLMTAGLFTELAAFLDGLPRIAS